MGVTSGRRDVPAQERRPRPLAKAAAGVAALVLILFQGPGAQASFLTDGVTYLLSLQDNTPGTGGFFQTAPDSGTYFAPEQGQFGLTLLRAYQVTGNVDYLHSANRLADAMIHAEGHSDIPSSPPDTQKTALGEIYFQVGDGLAPSNPIVWTQSTLFLQNLARATDDATLANQAKAFLNDNFFGPLTAQSYGAGDSSHAFTDLGGGGVGTAGYIGKLQTDCGEWSAWCLAKPVVAAHQAGQNQIASQLFQGIVDGLAAGGGAQAPGETYRYDSLGLAAAVWASALTGLDLQLSGGEWYTKYCDDHGGVCPATLSTADLASLLAGLITDGGGGLISDPFMTAAGYGTGGDLNDPFLDIESTGDAILALAALDPGLSTYGTEVGLGLQYLSDQQETGGCVACSQGYSDSVQAEVLQLYSETDAVANGPPGTTVQDFYPAPAPATLGLFATGLGLLGLTRRRLRAARP